MDREKIEFILRMRPPLTNDAYSHDIADILREPSIFRPIKRARFRKQFVNRVALVLTEHNQTFINNLQLNLTQEQQQ